MEQAYKRLFDEAQHYAPAPVDVMDYKSPAKALALGTSATSPCPGFSAMLQAGDCIDFSAEEQPSEPPAEQLASRQSAANSCLQQSVALEALCKAPEFLFCFPAEELASGQNTTDVCPVPTALPELQGARAGSPPPQQAAAEKLELPGEALAT